MNDVVVIGNQGVGKTSMVLTLAEQKTEHIEFVDPNVQKYYNPDTGIAAGTFRKEEETFLVNVNLLGGQRQIQVRWIDTPGEAWSDKNWKKNNEKAWLDIKQEVSQSQGVLLLLEPHRSMVKPKLLEEPTQEDDFPRPQAWANNLEDWLTFFEQNCSKATHILLSIHKADLFCDLNAEAKRWEYRFGKISWANYSDYVFKQYFSNASNIIMNYNRKHRVQLQFFITTINSSSLLELPWIYLSSYIANN